jgi:hypothetical protein
MNTIYPTTEIQAIICRFVTSGAYPHIAAEAAGVPREVFERWMRLGQSRHADRVYHVFRVEVLKARAQARLFAESKALAKDPLAWLKCGPGRDAPETPGWSNPVKGQVPPDQAAKLLLARESQELIVLLMELLEPYPEVREAVALALEHRSKTPDEPPPS